MNDTGAVANIAVRLAFHSFPTMARANCWRVANFGLNAMGRTQRVLHHR